MSRYLRPVSYTHLDVYKRQLEGKRRVERVVTDQGCYEADMVVFGIGFRPNTSLGQGRLRTFGNGAFLVDRRQETSVPGVYSVGDCATAVSYTHLDVYKRQPLYDDCQEEGTRVFGTHVLRERSN